MPQIGEIKKSGEIGRKGNHRHSWLACPECGIERWVEICKDNTGRNIICRSCAGKKLPHDRTIGKNHGMWKGGKRIDSHGYVSIWMAKENPYYSMANSINQLREHRLVMARHLGRCLLPTEYVHHKNGIRTDNRIENLKLADSVGAHMTEHTAGYRDGYDKGYRDGLEMAKRELREVSFS